MKKHGDSQTEQNAGLYILEILCHQKALFS